jgi:hypothetical protein
VGTAPSDCSVVILAVIVTDCEELMEFKFDVADSVVIPFTTETATAPLVLALKLESPEYFAVMLCDPGDKTAGLLFSGGHDAILPFELTFTVAKFVVPSTNVTVPVAVPSVPVPPAVPVICASVKMYEPYGMFVAEIPLPVMAL